MIKAQLKSDTFSLICLLWICIDAWSEGLHKAGAENPAYAQTAFTKQVDSNKTLFLLNELVCKK